MSTYITGVSDYIPQAQPFKPDLQFYGNVLQIKQQQYDQGFAQMSSLYSGILNSPMLRDDNNVRRDEFLKNIDDNIKKISGMDLSKQENIDAAQKIFKPFYEDKYIIHDMAYTKRYQGELRKAEMFRNCIDPAKCGGTYWDTGVKALNYQAEEFRKAGADDALRYSPGKYVSYQNVMEKAMKAAKESGLNVKMEYVNGRYQVTDENGALLLGDGKGGPGPLTQFLYGTFGNDPAIMDMFKTDAYVKRKDFSKAYAMEYGISEDAAESKYLNEIIQKTVPKLERNSESLKEQKNIISAQRQILEKQIADGGLIVENSPEMKSLELLSALEEKLAPAEAYQESLKQTISTASNLNDIQQLRDRADMIVANSLMQKELDSAAYTYAMGTAKRSIKADEYALADYRNALELSSYQKKMEIEDQYWIKTRGATKDEVEFQRQMQLKMMGGKNGIATHSELSQVDVRKMQEAGYTQGFGGFSDDQIAEAISRGLITPQGKDVNTPMAAGAGSETVTSAYMDGLKYLSLQGQAQSAKAKSNTDAALKFIGDAYINSTDDANRTNLKAVLGKALQNTIFKYDVDRFLGYDKTTGKYNNHKFQTNLSELSGAQASIINNVIAQELGKVENKDWAKRLPTTTKSSILDTQIQGQALLKLNQQMKDNVNAVIQQEIDKLPVVNQKAKEEGILERVALSVAKGKTSPYEMLTSFFKSNAVDDAEVVKKKLIYESLKDSNGLIAPEKSAREQFIKKAKGLFSNGNAAVMAYIGANPSAIADAAGDYFDKEYSNVRTVVEKKVNSFQNDYGQNGAGASASMLGKSYVMSSNDPKSKRVFMDNLTNVYRSNPELFNSDLPLNPLFNFWDQAVKTGDKKFNVDMEVYTQEATDKGGVVSSPEVRYRFKLSPDAAKEIYGHEKGFDPTQERFFTMSVPADKDPNQFFRRMVKSPLDISLRQPGASQTIDLGQGTKAVFKNVQENDQNKLSFYIENFPVLVGTNVVNGVPTGVKYDWRKTEMEYVPGDVLLEDKLKDAQMFIEKQNQVNQSALSSLSKILNSGY